jgi:hypothetical protein
MAFSAVVEGSEIILEPGSGSEEALAKLQEADAVMKELKNTQQQVDLALATLPTGSDKDRLTQMRDSNRGFFASEVLPLWEQIREYLGLSSSTVEPTYEPLFGALPLIPLVIGASIVAAAVAVITQATKAQAVELAILNDPALTASQKTAILTGSGVFGQIANLLRESKWLVFGVGAIAVFTLTRKR